MASMFTGTSPPGPSAASGSSPSVRGIAGSSTRKGTASTYTDIESLSTISGRGLEGGFEGTSESSSSDADLSNEEMSNSYSSGTDRDGRAQRRCCGPRRYVAVGAALALLGTVLVLLWPRGPDWTVREISVSKESVDALVKAFTDPKFNSTMTLTVNATVDMYNPNFVGAHAGDGVFQAHHDQLKLADVDTKAFTLGARSARGMTVVATSTMTPEISKAMLKAVLPDYKLQVDVVGSLPARARLLGGMILVPIVAHFDCKVDVDVLQLVQDPDKMVVGHSCSYGGSLA